MSDTADSHHADSDVAGSEVAPYWDGVERPVDALNDDMVTALYREIAALRTRLDESVWERQGAALVRQAKEHGDRGATILRVAELARRWEYTPGKQDAARQLLAALGIKDGKPWQGPSIPGRTP